MTISVTQQEKQFQPVTIVIDDERTFNLLRFVLGEFYDGTDTNEIVCKVVSINSYADAAYSMKDIKDLKDNLTEIFLK